MENYLYISERCLGQFNNNQIVLEIDLLSGLGSGLDGCGSVSSPLIDHR